MEPAPVPAPVRLPPPSSLGSALPLRPLPQPFSPSSAGKTFAPTRVFPSLAPPSPSLLAHIPHDVAGETAKQQQSLSAPPPPSSSWVLYNNSAQADIKRRKVARTQFTEEQKNILNHYFTQRNHMKNYKPLEIKDIERETGLTEHQIRIYFQNKRARTKAKHGAPPSPPTRAVASPPTMPTALPATTELPHQRLNSVLVKRKEPSPAPPSPPQAPVGTRSSAFAMAPTRDSPPNSLRASPNRLDLLGPALFAVDPISPREMTANPPAIQLATLRMIDSIAARMGMLAADAAQAKELMCGVFDGKHVPRPVLDHAAASTLVAASCLHIARRQNLRPLPIAAFDESLGLPAGLLSELVDQIIGNMRLVLNDVDATEYIAKALQLIELPEDKRHILRIASLTVLEAARRTEQQNVLRNPAALAAAALLLAAKQSGIPVALTTAAGALKVCQWSVRSKEEELARLLRL